MSNQIHLALLSFVLLCLIGAEPTTQDGRIEPNSLLRVTVKDWTGPGASSEFLRRVDPDGCITLPWVGKVEVGRLTAAEAARAVDQIYFEKNLIEAANSSVARIQIGVKAALKPGPFEKGDYVHIQMWDLQGPGIETRLIEQVGDNGSVELPQNVKVKLLSLSDAQAEEAIAAAYRDAQLIARLQICVLRVSPQEAKVLQSSLDKR